MLPTLLCVLMIPTLVLSHGTPGPQRPSWPWDWSHIRTWCFPTFSALPLTDAQVTDYSRFDMIDICAPGLRLFPNSTYAANVTQASEAMAKQILDKRPSALVSPYIGFELGQSWYKAQRRFNTDPSFSHMWLRYANGSVVTCNNHTHDMCALLQRLQPDAKVYDWRVPGMIEYFLDNITGPFLDNSLYAGVFYDDIYTLCDYVSSLERTGDFSPGSGKSFCAAALSALTTLVDRARSLDKMAILSIKGDETNNSNFNMSLYSEIVEEHGGMAYFEYWAQWVGQPRNENQLQYAIQWGSAGVPMQMHASPGLCKFNDTSFPLAMFLIAANEHSYFSIGEGWNPSPGQSWWLPEYDQSLGNPTGPGKMTSPHVYERHFEHLHVVVNMSDCNSTVLQWL